MQYFLVYNKTAIFKKCGRKIVLFVVLRLCVFLCRVAALFSSSFHLYSSLLWSGVFLVEVENGIGDWTSVYCGGMGCALKRAFYV